MKLKDREAIADVFEAMEKVKEWRPFYEAVLKQTGDKKQARTALIFALRMAHEISKEGESAA